MRREGFFSTGQTMFMTLRNNNEGAEGYAIWGKGNLKGAPKGSEHHRPD
jgi:hypothetical protein